MKNINLALTIIMIVFCGQLFSQNTIGSAQNESGSCIDETDLTILNIDETILISDPPVQEIDGENSSPIELDPNAFKNVFFVHGLGGQSSSWAVAADHVADTYKAMTPEVNYLQNITIPQAANFLDNYFGAKNYFLEKDKKGSIGEQSIFIGHSMGGVVGRQMDYDRVIHNSNKRFSAFATFGSPHHGAQIIESLQNGNVEQYLKTGCEVITKPYLKELAAELDIQFDGFWGLLFNKRIRNLQESMFGFLESTAKNIVCDELMGTIFQSLAADIAPPIGAGLNPNSELISTLGTHEIELNNVAFFGVEKGTYEGVAGDGVDGYASLRQLHSLTKMSPFTEYGGENEDESYIESYINMKNYLLSQASYYSGPPSYDYKMILFSPWTNPLDPDLKENAECIEVGGTPVFKSFIPQYTVIMTCDLPGNANICSAYFDAYHYISDFDKEYRILFGHLEIEYDPVGQRPVCKCYNVNGDLVDMDDVPCHESEVYQNFMYNSNIHCEDEFELVYDYVEYLHPGDCIVVETSASNFPGVRKTRKLSDNNHQQMRNSRETKEYFNELFKGEEYGSEFKLNER